MKESAFQSNLIKEIKTRFPGSVVLKNDPNYIRSIPDLLILYNDKWAALECKNSKQNAKKALDTNQGIWVNKLNNMSYASFIFPENKEDILDEMEGAFGD